jgi:uncharacterized protein DUF2516
MSALLFPLNGVLLLVHLAALVLTIVALVDAAIRPDGAFVAAGKQSKIFWILLLVLGIFIAFVGVIAAIVYFVDVRPAVRQVGGGGGSGRGSSSDGPYGPYRR